MIAMLYVPFINECSLGDPLILPFWITDTRPYNRKLFISVLFYCLSCKILLSTVLNFKGRFTWFLGWFKANLFLDLAYFSSHSLDPSSHTALLVEPYMNADTKSHKIIYYYKFLTAEAQLNTFWDHSKIKTPYRYWPSSIF